MPYFEGSRGRIHHEAWLPEETPRAVVVLLHGYGEHLGLYDALARRFTAAGDAVHALDCVGHGRSDGERGRIDSWDDYVSDAHALVRIAADRHPGAPIVLVGHSGGALAAYLLAARHPNLATAAVLSAGPLQPLDWVSAELAGDSPEAGDLDPTTLLSTHPAYVHALMHDPLCLQGGFHPATLRALQTTWPEVAAALADGRPEIPVLVVHGEDDPVVPVSIARSVAAALPQATLRVFPGDLHDVLNEHDRDAVHDEVLTFVGDVAVGAASRA
jgi:alpha-beta hydrolase superfamily lysophospholipase